MNKESLITQGILKNERRNEIFFILQLCQTEYFARGEL